MAPKKKMQRFHGFCFHEMFPQPNWRLLLELKVFHGDLQIKVLQILTKKNTTV
jgi:hypothetical protein